MKKLLLLLTIAAASINIPLQSNDCICDKAAEIANSGAQASIELIKQVGVKGLAILPPLEKIAVIALGAYAATNGIAESIITIYRANKEKNAYALIGGYSALGLSILLTHLTLYHMATIDK